MIPSVVAHEVIRALHDFLATGFGPSNPALAHVLEDFLAQDENLVKGTYLSIALPPKLAPEGGEPFPEVPLGFKPYRRQLDSAAAHGGRSTIFATGTGSGKTECFLWPILDHCRRHAAEQGVQAILVYPMNALAFNVGEREQAPHTTDGAGYFVRSGSHARTQERKPLSRLA